MEDSHLFNVDCPVKKSIFTQQSYQSHLSVTCTLARKMHSHHDAIEVYFNTVRKMKPLQGTDVWKSSISKDSAVKHIALLTARFYQLHVPAVLVRAHGSETVKHFNAPFQIRYC